MSLSLSLAAVARLVFSGGGDRQRGKWNLRRPLSVAASSSSGDSYLDMWNRAIDRERKSQQFQRIISTTDDSDNQIGEDKNECEMLDDKTEMFNQMLEISKEERDRIQRQHIIDRAAAAIAAARAILDKSLPPLSRSTESSDDDNNAGEEADGEQRGYEIKVLVRSPSTPGGLGTPGPDFWSWSPPSDIDMSSGDDIALQPARKPSLHHDLSRSVMENDQSMEFLTIPFESSLAERKHAALLPPLQSLLEVDKVGDTIFSSEVSTAKNDNYELDARNAEEAAEALSRTDEGSLYGVNPDGSRWWRETGIEERPDGVICKWTLVRGVSADKAVEWEDKYWEAADQFDYKELGSAKSGRDAFGNVWREFWRESMWQDIRSGLAHIEKTADKWGKNSNGTEWQEKWWEQYDASGQAEKWAHKWCSLDPMTPLEAGHAHVWHERWGEKYDGKGGSTKYTDKWAERSEGDGWSKWGDKWDEDFDQNGYGVKQGEAWWEGKHGERWNRTWGEQHNGSGWIHKYGKSSSGEHWDTHVQQDTWYEPYPHYGFRNCFENSVQLRRVRRPAT